MKIEDFACISQISGVAIDASAPCVGYFEGLIVTHCVTQMTKFGLQTPKISRESL